METTALTGARPGHPECDRSKGAPAPVTDHPRAGPPGADRARAGSTGSTCPGAQLPCTTMGVDDAGEAFAYGVSATPKRDACRCLQARTRHRSEQYTADLAGSTPTVHDRPHTGHTACSPRCIAATRNRVRRILRHRRDLHRLEQNTAAAAAIVTGNGSPHSRQYRRAVPPAPTPQIIQPSPTHGQSSKTPSEPNMSPKSMSSSSSASVPLGVLPRRVPGWGIGALGQKSTAR